MGQKTNPIGFRLAVRHNWQSRWFAPKKEFPALLLEDQKIREHLFAKLKQAAVPRIFIERAGTRVRVKIYTARPGVVIGKKGADISGNHEQEGEQQHQTPGAEAVKRLGEGHGLVVDVADVAQMAEAELDIAQLGQARGVVQNSIGTVGQGHVGPAQTGRTRPAHQLKAGDRSDARTVGAQKARRQNGASQNGQSLVHCSPAASGSE